MWQHRPSLQRTGWTRTKPSFYKHLYYIHRTCLSMRRFRARRRRGRRSSFFFEAERCLTESGCGTIEEAVGYVPGCTGNQTPSDTTDARSPKAESRQAHQILRRRRIDFGQKLREQASRGRPGSSWRQCGDGSCVREGCIYVDCPCLLVMQPIHGGHMATMSRPDAFFDLTVSHIWGRDDTGAPFEYRLKQVESFVWSVPVRGAAGRLDTLCQMRHWKLSPRKAAAFVTVQWESLVHMVSTTRLEITGESVHEFVEIGSEGKEDATGHDNGTLHHLLQQFCVSVEAWRRRGLSNGADWDFGTDEAISDLVGAILVYFVFAIKRRVMKSQSHGHEDLTQEWETWLNEHQEVRIRGKDGAALDQPGKDGEYCFKGLGLG